MRAPKPNIENIMDSGLLDEDLTDLQYKYEAWYSTNLRGKAAVWTLLSNAYELGTKIYKKPELQFELINKVSELPDVKKSNHWDVSSKRPFDLLLVLLLGLSEKTKATKSQWLRTLKAARTAGVPAKQDDFIAWIEKTGGIDGVLRLGKKASQKRQTISQLAEKVSEPESATPLSKVALNCTQQKLPEGYALILVKESDQPGQMLPIHTIINESQIATALKTAAAAIIKEQKAQLLLWEQEKQDVVRKINKKIRVRYNARKKTKVGKAYPLTFEEFLGEELSGDDVLVPDMYKNRLHDLFPDSFNENEPQVGSRPQTRLG